MGALQEGVYQRKERGSVQSFLMAYSQLSVSREEKAREQPLRGAGLGLWQLIQTLLASSRQHCLLMLSVGFPFQAGLGSLSLLFI